MLYVIHIKTVIYVCVWGGGRKGFLI